MPVHYPSEAGKPYRPSNGTEGEMFQCHFCYQCKHDDHCHIALNAMCYRIDEPEYPKEWVFDADGRPTCTAFEVLP